MVNPVNFSSKVKPIRDPIDVAQNLLSSGMSNSDFHARVIAENIANSDVTSTTPGGDPYQRKVVRTHTKHDRKIGADKVEITGVTKDKRPFKLEYDPNHPAADMNGYVKRPNIEPVREMVDATINQKNHKMMTKMYEMTMDMRKSELSLLKR